MEAGLCCELLCEKVSFMCVHTCWCRRKYTEIICMLSESIFIIIMLLALLRISRILVSENWWKSISVYSHKSCCGPRRKRVRGLPMTYTTKLPRIFSPFNPIPEIIGHFGLTGIGLFFCAELDVYLIGATNQAKSQTKLNQFIIGMINLMKKLER